MKARVEENFPANSLKVWVYEITPGGGARLHRMVQTKDGETYWEIVDVDEGALPDPSFEIPTPVAEALAPELLGVVPPNTSQARHLDDTIEVRDRLLTMIEREVA